MKRLNWVVTGVAILSLAIVLLAGCGVSKSEYEALQTEKANVETELAAVQSDLTSLQADYDALNADYQAASSELADIKAVYPPRDFNDYNELEEWVDEHCPIDYSAFNIFSKHLSLQEKALADGYIWSVYTETGKTEIVSCVVAGDSIYYVWLEGYIEWVCWK